MVILIVRSLCSLQLKIEAPRIHLGFRVALRLAVSQPLSVIEGGIMVLSVDQLYGGGISVRFFMFHKVRILVFIRLTLLTLATTVSLNSATAWAAVVPEYTLESGVWHQLVVPGKSTDVSVQSLFADELPASEYDNSWTIYLWDAPNGRYVNPGLSTLTWPKLRRHLSPAAVHALLALAVLRFLYSRMARARYLI